MYLKPGRDIASVFGASTAIILPFYHGQTLWMEPHFVTIRLKATEHYFHKVRFIMLYKVVLSFWFVVCDHSNEDISSTFIIVSDHW